MVVATFQSVDVILKYGIQLKTINFMCLTLETPEKNDKHQTPDVKKSTAVLSHNANQNMMHMY